jgi:hypothetical protein
MVINMKSFDRLFITGCDSTTEWMLPWFLENFRKHNQTANIFVCNFGISDKAYDEYCILADGIIDMTSSKLSGWFKKPSSMVEASHYANYICWLDTDCEVRSSLQTVFEYCETNKLTMAVDQPWSTRRLETWHNSGVVAFKGRPSILDEWKQATETNPKEGDQEILHKVLGNELRRMIHINDLPKTYNTLRLDLIDNTAPRDIKVMHWTGHKGKAHIRGLIK